MEGDIVREVNQEKLLLSDSSLLVHFRESLYGIITELLLCKILFGGSLSGFNEATLGALPDIPIDLSRESLQCLFCLKPPKNVADLSESKCGSNK